MTYSFTEQLTEINHQSVLEMWMKYFVFTVRSQGQICMFLVECPIMNPLVNELPIIYRPNNCLPACK